MVNKYFFDKKSKGMFYVKGSFYSCYNPGSRIIFRYSDINLVEIVKRELDIDNNIVSDPRKNSHCIEFTEHYLYSKLEKMGLNVPKSKREFPKDIPKYGMSHFIRGFLEGQAIINILNKKYIITYIVFNNLFVLGLHYALVEYAGIERGPPKGDSIAYANNDSLKIRDLIYKKDWKYTEEHGLYLKKKREKMFGTNYSCRKVGEASKIKARKRVDKSQKTIV